MNEVLILALLLLAAGLAPLASAIFRGRLGRLTAGAVGLVLLSTVAFAVAASLAGSRPPRRGPLPGVARTAHEDDYVGSDACRSCHPYEHASWHASFHRTMTRTAGPDSVLAPFDGTELHLEGVTWRVERRGDEFWVHGEEGQRQLDRRIAMVTGSHNYQLYWLEALDDRGLQQFPLVYFIEEGVWIPRKARFLQPPIERTPDESGRWRAHCIKCHATHGRKEARPSGETRVAELGISCEACHGPGGAHVAANRSPLRRYFYHVSGEPDPTIVNPRRLPHDRATEVCAQCHGIEIFLDDERAEDWFHEGIRFRPGDELARFQTTIAGRYEDNPPEVRRYLDDHPNFSLEFCFWSDGHLRVVGREYHGMQESPCFQRGEMSCLSCHALHRSEDDPRPFTAWAEDQLGTGMDGDRSCLQCHEGYGETDALTAHTHHAAESTGSQCLNCHMPYTTWGLLRAVRSHTIGSPSVAASVATGRPNACNQCHLDRTLLWTAGKLDEWYGVTPPELSDDERETAASILWALRGDAGQRALMAWSMGWPAARDASGTGWMVPFLTALLMDPYHAVRYNAQRSLRRYPEYADVTTDGTAGATKDEQWEMVQQILPHWERTFPASGAPREARLLLEPDGRMDGERFRRLAEERDERVLVLFE